MKYSNLILILFVLALSACAPDPRREAQAFATRIQAEQDAADREQSRQQDADLHALEVQKQEALAHEWEAAMNRVMHTAAIIGQYAISLVIICAAIGAGLALVGSGRALARSAEVRANLIQLNPTTRQYPLLIQYVGHGKFTLTNPNVNATLLLDTRNEPERQMILGMSNTQYAGALARESRLSLHPGEVSIIPAPFVEVAHE